MLSITDESLSTTLKIVSVHSVSKITVVGTSSSVEITGMAIIKADSIERVNFMVVYLAVIFAMSSDSVIGRQECAHNPHNPYSRLT